MLGPVVRLTGVALAVSLFVPGLAWGDTRSATQILKELDQVKLPVHDTTRQSDPAYTKQFAARLKSATEKRTGLIWELYQVEPKHPRVPTLMAERWSVRPHSLPGGQVIMEAADVLRRTDDPKLKVEATYALVYMRLHDGKPDDPIARAGVEDFVKLTSTDPRGATLLRLAGRRTTDEKVKAALDDRIIQDYPGSTVAAKLRGVRDQDSLVGKPFPLAFTDAMTGAKVSVEQFKGKVVVIDFWATWCPPCVAGMPEMKRLYAQYHKQGVEFLGVSLDAPEAEGGLKNLKKFVRDHNIAWPQYYQGDDWNSAFSVACGINSIPAVFVVDAEGKLHSNDAGEHLTSMIPELLKAK